MSSNGGTWTSVASRGITVSLEEFPPLLADDKTTVALKDPLDGLKSSWESDSEEEAPAPADTRSADEEALESEALKVAQELRFKKRQASSKLEEATKKVEKLCAHHEQIKEELQQAEEEKRKRHMELQRTNSEYEKSVKVLSDAFPKQIQPLSEGNTTSLSGVSTIARPQGPSGGNDLTNSTARPQDGFATERLSFSRQVGWFFKDGTCRPCENDCFRGRECLFLEDGTCPYNHGSRKCPEGIFCKPMCCSNDHPRGRAQYVLQNRKD